MTAEFDPESNELQLNETVEDFGVDLVDRNETVEEEPATNGTTQSVPASELELGWSKEAKKIWVKYGLSPAYLREMRKIEDRLLGEHVCSTVDILEGKPLGACTEFAIPEVHSGIFIDEGCTINRAYWVWKRTGAVSEFEEVGRAVFKILQDPWGGAPIYLDADERKTCLLYTSPSPRD